MSKQPEKSAEDRDAALMRRAQSLFADRVAGMDAQTRSKLTQARHAALEASGAGAVHRPRLWIAAGGLATATLAAVVFIDVRTPDFVPSQATMNLDDVDIIASADDFELFDEVEFYSWMDDESAASAANGAG